MTAEIEPAVLKRLTEGTTPYAVLDVREWGEYLAAQVPGANSLPRIHIDKYVEYLVPGKKVRIVVYCDTGFRSGKAANTLEALGYEDVSILAGGIGSWIAQEYPVARGWSQRGKEQGERIQVEQNVPEITVEEFRQLDPGSVCLLDTRSEAEFLSAHLPAAMSAPGGLLRTPAAEAARRGARLITSCAGRTRSLVAAYLLRRLGYPEVYALKGGIGAWRIAGYGDELQSGGSLPLGGEDVSYWRERVQRIAAEDRVYGMPAAELHERVRNDELLYLLDVRGLGEYALGHIGGAGFCPFEQLFLLTENIVGVRNATIVAVCDNGIRSVLAATLLKSMGYSDVAYLRDGLKAWTNSGFRLESGLPYEVDFGQPEWLVRFLAGIPSRVCLPRRRRAAPIACHRALTPAELVAELERGTEMAILDVRALGDFVVGHIPNAEWLPSGLTEIKIAEAVKTKKSRIVLYCRTGEESAVCAAILESSGYSDVSVLKLGFEQWQREGREISQGLGNSSELEQQAIAEVGLFANTGPYLFNNARMAQHLKDEEELGRRYKDIR